MKKLVLSALVASAFLSSTAFAEGEPVPQLTVNGGQITFTGEIIDGACSIDAGDSDKIVKLPSVKATTFTAPDQVANAKTEFTITLRDCSIETYKNVAVTFSGQNDATNPKYLGNNNPGAGAAQNVALQLYGQDGEVIVLGTKEAGKKVMVNGTNVLRYSVDYVSTKAAVKSGPVTSTADFQLNYN
ncbi:fimbrial protein [Orbus wheelerorum]|uniref:fimbrial protein n=1 Tax=Orbus wheelerorum TaxID=3074111 RepID=UPI00370DDB74